MASAWKPGSVIDDGRGNLTLIAHDGTQMRIERGDQDTLIKRVKEERSRYASIDTGVPFEEMDHEEVTPVIPFEPIMQYFNPAKRDVRIRLIGRKFADLAVAIVMTLQRSAERTVALRKLLEAQDAVDHGIDYKPDKPD